MISMNPYKWKYSVWFLVGVLSLSFSHSAFGQGSIYGDFPYQRTLLLGVQGDMVFPATQKPDTNPNKARFIKDLGLQLVPILPILLVLFL